MQRSEEVPAYENELYVARCPVSDTEVEEQEAFFVKEYKDNPRFLMMSISMRDLEQQFRAERPHEIQGNQRISIIEKSTG